MCIIHSCSILRVGILGVCIVGASCESRKDSGAQLPGKVSIIKNIDVDFETNGMQFILGCEGELGYPIEAFLHLYVQDGQDTIRILSPKEMNKLNGIIVSSDKMALSYVRLFTSEDTFMAVEFPSALEIDENNAIVKNINNSYIVTRTILSSKPDELDNYPVYKIEEDVTNIGKYNIISKKYIRNASAEEAAKVFLE